MKSASPFTRKNTITIYLHKLFCLRLERKKRFRLSRCITPLRGCGCTNTPHGGTEPPYGDNKHKKCLQHCGRFPHRCVMLDITNIKIFSQKEACHWCKFIQWQATYTVLSYIGLTLTNIHPLFTLPTQKQNNSKQKYNQWKYPLHKYFYP